MKTKVLLFSCEIAGAQFTGNAHVIGLLNVGAKLSLLREPENKFDKNAIRIKDGTMNLGYIPATNAGLPSRLMDAGFKLFACVLQKDAAANHIRSAVQIGVYLEATA